MHFHINPFQIRDRFYSFSNRRLLSSLLLPGAERAETTGFLGEEGGAGAAKNVGAGVFQAWSRLLTAHASLSTEDRSFAPAQVAETARAGVMWGGESLASKQRFRREIRWRFNIVRDLDPKSRSPNR